MFLGWWGRLGFHFGLMGWIGLLWGTSGVLVVGPGGDDTCRVRVFGLLI